MLEYLAVCFVCVVGLSLTLSIEPSYGPDTPFLAWLSLFMFAIPLLPVMIILYFVTRIIRNE